MGLIFNLTNGIDEKMNKTEKQETVEVTLKLPKQITEFIKESWDTENLEETLTKEIIDLCLSQIDCDAGEEQIDPE